MLRRLGLLTIPAAGLALLGASFVFAQQIAPAADEILVVVPQATPGLPDNPFNLPLVPPESDKPSLPNGRPVPTVQPTAVPTQPTQTAQPTQPLSLPGGPAYLIANIPAELRPMPEAKPVPSATNLAAMTGASPELQPMAEAKAQPSFPSLMSLTQDPALLPLPEAKPLPSALSIPAMVIAPPELQPMREAAPVSTR